MIRSAFLLASSLLAVVPAAAQTRAAGAARVDAQFARTDRNGDDAVSRDELARRVATIHLAGRPVTPAETRAIADRWFARADTDRNGGISRDEARRLYARSFARFDADGNGRIGPAERDAARAMVLAEAVR